MVSHWTRIRGAIDPIVRPYNLYTAYPLGWDEHVDSTDMSVAEFRGYLEVSDYEPQWLSAAKKHPETGALHDLSYRRVPGEHPDEWKLTGFSPRECQYHVHYIDGDVFSHYEVRPDFIRPRPSIYRLHTHYRPEYGREYLRGVTDLDLPGTA